MAAVRGSYSPRKSASRSTKGAKMLTRKARPGGGAPGGPGFASYNLRRAAAKRMGKGAKGRRKGAGGKGGGGAGGG